MARRGMVEELQRHYDALMAQKGTQFWFPYNLELLTALRRAQGKPDPLKIEVSMADPARLGIDGHASVVQASITNVDAGGETVHFTRGGDDRGGRRERWRVLLIDDQGRRARDSNFSPFNGGGLATVGPFAYGQVDRDGHAFDLRRYVAPSHSGKYQLQLLYHNEFSLANEPDVSGLIVTKSEPIKVIIHVPERLSDGPSGMQTFFVIVAAAGLLTAAAALGNRRRSSQSLISRRNLVWLILLAAVALGVWLDDLYCDRQLADLDSDADAHWTIRIDPAA
jgi:hypothetical protein